MKYSVLGFNQELVMATNLALRDLFLLNYIRGACGSPTMKHIVKDDKSFVWLNHEKMLTDIPILRISEQTLKNLLCVLKADGYIDSIQVANKNLAGSQTYYGITEKTEALLYKQEVSNIVSLEVPKNVPLEVPDSVPQDNKLLNNKLDTQLNTSTKVEVHPDGCSGESMGDTVSVTPTEKKKENKRQKILTPSNSKKPNLYERCSNEIVKRYGLGRLNASLHEYLEYRLKSKLHPIGFNGWVGLLNKLDILGQTDDEKCKIIEQSIRMKWDTFAELKEWNKKPAGRALFGETTQIKSKPSDPSQVSDIEF